MCWMPTRSLSATHQLNLFRRWQTRATAIGQWRICDVNGITESTLGLYLGAASLEFSPQRMDCDANRTLGADGLERPVYFLDQRGKGRGISTSAEQDVENVGLMWGEANSFAAHLDDILTIVECEAGVASVLLHRGALIDQAPAHGYSGYQPT
jgi:hypothetical protein